jgi:hypothetical protein
MNFKQKLMACTALLGVLLFHPATAGAQSAEAQKIERLETHAAFPRHRVERSRGPAQPTDCM